MDEEFYIRFENRFRGSREVIKARVKVYLPIIEPLNVIYPDGLVVDVGCGRGEWLELLNESGWQAIGVDTNSKMVDLCNELGLSAVTGDAIQYLGTLESESVSVVSGFHIIEHLPFDLLQRLVQEAHRVLRPGGILILETPNPENYRVGAINFYMDPTHRNPLPPSLMQFLAEESGFSQSVILRLNGPEQPVFQETSWALFANPDYSLVAQKQKSMNMAAFQYFDSIRSEHVDFLALLSTSVNHLKGELNGVRNELNGVQIDLNGARNELNGVRSELNGVRNELNGVQIELNGVRNELNGVRSELIEFQISILWRVYTKLKMNHYVRAIVGILSRLFPLRTLPKRTTLKITRLSKESGHRIQSLIYGTTPTESEFPMTEQHIPMSSQVREIYRDLVNTIKETDNKKRNEQSKMD